MKHLCTRCGYIYDEMMWEQAEGIPFGTTLESMEWIFYCPNCDASSELFQWVPPYIHSLDESFLLSIEHEHEPLIEHGEDGYIHLRFDHNQDNEHFVWNIWIFDEYWDMVHQEFFDPWKEIIAEFDVWGLDEYEIRIECSVHGIFSKKISE
jgi:rubredoxin